LIFVDPSKVTGGYRFILVQSSGEEEETEKAAHSTNGKYGQI